MGPSAQGLRPVPGVGLPVQGSVGKGAVRRRKRTDDDDALYVIPQS